MLWRGFVYEKYLVENLLKNLIDYSEKTLINLSIPGKVCSQTTHQFA